MRSASFVNSASKKLLFLIAAAVLVLGGLLVFWRTEPKWNENPSEILQRSSTPDRLQQRENEADKTYWAKEMLAQRCGRTIEDLWDRLNATKTNKLEVLESFPVEAVVLPKFSRTNTLAHGIDVYSPAPSGSKLSDPDWRAFVQQQIANGWQLETMEFRQDKFDTNAQGNPQQSEFYFSAHLSNPSKNERATLEGALRIEWAAEALPNSRQRPGVRQSSAALDMGTDNESGGLPSVKFVDASGLILKTRTGAPFFERVLEETVNPPENFSYMDPLIVYDLDGDGLPEIILPASNLVYRRNAQGKYVRSNLCRYPPDHITSAVIADFDRDGAADLLCANATGLLLFKGSNQGTFDEPPRLVWTPPSPLKNTMVLTCGDIDRDGDLDVFLAQYKVPTLGVILRPHYYDANDGWPSYLLLNDGRGNFSDATEQAGLGAKRFRRTYAASLVDLDGDGYPELAVASDFAGLDLYKNDTNGHFHEVTHEWAPESHAFGMSLTFADFNLDGRLDCLLIGMPSPAVNRLEHLGLHRPYSQEDAVMRPAMAFGNRLLLAKPGGGFEQTQLSHSIARSGWSWGCSAFDFDNDGYPDVYIANGLETKQSVRDYEADFWLHDIFVDDSVDDVSASKYFIDKFGRTRGQGWSYGGYEKNRLFLNQAGESFADIAHFGGVALERDCRNLVTEDLDGDGRVDLVLTTLEVWPKPKQTLQVFRNTLPDPGHWIGFRFREQGAGTSPVNVQLTIHYQGRTATREIVTGDSHRSQHSTRVHFGLGKVTTLDTAEVRWSNGTSVTNREVSVDRYYSVDFPDKR